MIKCFCKSIPSSLVFLITFKAPLRLDSNGKERLVYERSHARILIKTEYYNDVIQSE